MEPNTLLEIKSLDIAFSSRFFRQTTIKETFVEALKSPWNFISNRNRTRHILKNLNLRVSRGDRVALIGINGCGKTTLCRCIARTLQPSRGSVVSTPNHRIIMQSDSFFFPELTGAENATLLAGFLYPELSETERKDLVNEALQFSGLGHTINSPVETYSLGMKSRLSLSLSTAKSHDLLVLDEVYTHADEFFQNRIQERLKKQILDSGAVIIVSHYERDIMELCNRGIVLQDGEIKYDGSVETALKAYRFMNGGKS